MTRLAEKAVLGPFLGQIDGTIYRGEQEANNTIYCGFWAPSAQVLGEEAFWVHIDTL